MNTSNHRKFSTTSFCGCLAICSLLVHGILFAAEYKSNREKAISKISHLSYQSAAKYSHLNWNRSAVQPVTIGLLPIINGSGIPMQDRTEKTEYYNHGSIPKSADLLFSQLAKASGYFSLANKHPEYQLQLSINRYQLPFLYEPDDSWYQTQSASVDRWFVEPKTASISLSLTINNNVLVKEPWVRTIKMTLGSCDLNKDIQPLPADVNENKTLRAYTQSIPGQAFVAASNYLILQAIQYVNQQSKLAQVVRKDGNELFLSSKRSTFNQGDKLGIYPNDDSENPSALPMGTIQIIKSYNHQAVAYPLNIHLGLIREGDWVELSNHSPFAEPQSVFNSKNSCAPVTVASL